MSGAALCSAVLRCALLRPPGLQLAQFLTERNAQIAHSATE
jgi:hypothetical protein